MPRLSVCPQHHVWTSAGHKSDVAAEVCPVCGMQGRPAAVVLTNTDAAVETIPPAMLPPVVDDVTLVQARSPVADDCAADSDAGAVPTVPGYEIVRELSDQDSAELVHDALQRLRSVCREPWTPASRSADNALQEFHTCPTGTGAELAVGRFPHDLGSGQWQFSLAVLGPG